MLKPLSNIHFFFLVFLKTKSLLNYQIPSLILRIFQPSLLYHIQYTALDSWG